MLSFFSKLRIKLGLKPLEVPDSSTEKEGTCLQGKGAIHSYTHTCNLAYSERLETLKVPLETIGPFACSKTLSLPIVIAVNSLGWYENHDHGKDESNRKPQ